MLGSKMLPSSALKSVLPNSEVKQLLQDVKLSSIQLICLEDFTIQIISVLFRDPEHDLRLAINRKQTIRANN